MFTEGETVTHKAGGPTMVIATLCRDGNDVSYNCTWFAGTDLKRANFSGGELVRVMQDRAGAIETGYDPLGDYR